MNMNMNIIVIVIFSSMDVVCLLRPLIGATKALFPHAGGETTEARITFRLLPRCFWYFWEGSLLEVNAFINVAALWESQIFEKLF